MVKADGNTACSIASEKVGSVGSGNPDGISGKRDPMVSTFSPSSAAPSEPAITTIRKAGRRGANRRRPMISASAAPPTATVAPSTLPATEK